MLFFNDPSPKFRKLISNISDDMEAFIDSKQFIKGKNVNLLENKLSNFLEVNEFFGCANGTDAITIALLASELPEGSKIAIPAVTAPATAVSVIRAKMVPIIIDVNEMALMCFDSLDLAISKEDIKGIIFVHLYGNVCDIERIIDYKDKGYLTIEDCAQSFGSSMNSINTGSVADFGTHSFYPTKNLSCPGDGGGISVGNCDEELSKKIRMISEYGWNKERKVILEGLNSRLDELHAKFLLKALNNFSQELVDKQALLNSLCRSIEAKESIKILSQSSDENINVSPHLAVIDCVQPDIIEELAIKHEISLGRHYEVPLPNHPFFKDTEAFFVRKNPIWTHISNNTRSLPFFWGMNKIENTQLMEFIDEIL